MRLQLKCQPVLTNVRLLAIRLQELSVLSTVWEKVSKGFLTCTLYKCRTGKPTCITYNGNSLVDYCLVNKDMLNTVGYFEVHNFTVFSNHCPISCALFTNFFHNLQESNYKLNPLPGKFLWTEEAVQTFSQNINSQHFGQRLANFMQTNFTHTEAITDSISSILVDCAKKSAKFFKKSPNIKSRKFKKKPWFSNSCHDLKTSLRNYEKLVNKFPNNNEYRKSFYSCRTKFRRVCKQEEKAYKQKIYNEINCNIDNSPKTFWDLVNKLDKVQSGQKIPEDLPHETFFSIFQNFKQLK